MNYSGMFIGLGSFLFIGLLHPIVIKSEYHFGTKIWPVFLIVGLACSILSLFCKTDVVSALLAVFGFSSLWSILELFQQEKRVMKGWFPSNPKKKIKSSKGWN